jgi:geranylgeranyl transferase type-2 subunit beta
VLLDDFDPSAPPFYRGLHVHYIVNLSAELETSIEGAMTTHLKMSGVYWSLAGLSMILPEAQVWERMKRDEILEWLFTCYDEASGGFGGNTYHDAHLLFTLSAVQILAMLDALEDPRFLREKVVEYIASLQLPTGAFVGDLSPTIREIDTRFSYCAVCALSLLGRLDAIDVESAANYVMRCRNDVDGGFGCTPGAESHAGQVFCCVAALSICQRLDLMKTKLLAWWLAERQVDSGGLNGRPEKQADVCYSWWILSVMSILGTVHYISSDHLARFILNCQDDEDGGIADRPDDMVDVFHTFFGIAGLSLTGHLHREGKPDCRRIDPVYALPVDVVRRLGLQAQVIVTKIHDDDADPDGAYPPVDERLSQYSILYRD